MKRTTILGICITAFVAIAAWAPNALAYSNGSGCASCHSFTGAQHNLHTSQFACSVCHVRNGDDPIVANSCANCHDPVPLQTRHVDNYGQSCDNCHDLAPPAETNCSDGIDNNNNGLTDCADPDCIDFVGQPTTCGDGACAAEGNLICQGDGTFVDNCQPGESGAEGPSHPRYSGGIPVQPSGHPHSRSPGRV